MRKVTLLSVLCLPLILGGCSSDATGDCIDPDGDQYGSGEGCLGHDCLQTDETCWEGACCPADCTDPDGDQYGVGPDCLGADCDECAYLTGITLPSYLGATNPAGSLWVDGLLDDVTNTTWLREQSGAPGWVE